MLRFVKVSFLMRFIFLFMMNLFLVGVVIFVVSRLMLFRLISVRKSLILVFIVYFWFVGIVWIIVFLILVMLRIMKMRFLMKMVVRVIF